MIIGYDCRKRTTVKKFSHKVFAVLFALVAANSAAFGHAKLVSSVPVDGSHVAVGLTQLKLAFSKPMRLTVIKVTHKNTDTHIVESGKLPVEFVKTADIEVPAMTPGPYQVRWTAVAADGHIMTGTINFSVGAASSDLPQ